MSKRDNLEQTQATRRTPPGGQPERTRPLLAASSLAARVINQDNSKRTHPHPQEEQLTSLEHTQAITMCEDGFEGRDGVRRPSRDHEPPTWIPQKSNTLL